MRICFIAPAESAHTKKWCHFFTSQGHDVHVISFTNEKIDNVNVHWIPLGNLADSGDVSKIKYLLKAPDVRRAVKEIKPDIINVHYATSYGTVAALAGLKNYILSVWGADVYDFPRKSILHRMMLKYSLSKASYIFSTSKAMAEETKKYINKDISVTPFGVNIDLFSPKKRNRRDDTFVIGTVKGLTYKYGIDYLLRAVADVRKQLPDEKIELRIAGKGPNEIEFKKLADNLGINDITRWLGFISQDQAAHEWANMDVAVVPSVLESESFGVSAVEAGASGIAVIISDIPGLMEATNPGLTSIVVPRKNSDEIAKAIIKLYQDENLRKKMGSEGRKYVEQNFEYKKCFSDIEKLFQKINNRL